MVSGWSSSRIYGFLIAGSVETGSNPVNDSHCLLRVISERESKEETRNSPPTNTNTQETKSETTGELLIDFLFPAPQTTRVL